jgi:hypothetical protein
MGANAVTTVPVYTAGEVLTAADLNITNSGIPVFASTVERDAAFGGTGEKTLAEGQFAYLETGNVTQYYDGAAWQPVPNGLTLIKTQTIGTTVSSVVVSDVFSATYDNYKILFSGGVASTNNTFNMTLGATTTGYYRFAIFGNYTATTVNGTNSANAANWGDVVYNTVNSINGELDLFGPNLAKNTQFRGSVNSSQTAGLFVTQGGYLANTTQYTDFTLTINTGTVTGGTIRVYGYQNS